MFRLVNISQNKKDESSILVLHTVSFLVKFGSYLLTDYLNSIRHILLTVLKWCLSRRDLKTGNSKGLETTVLLVTEVSKNLLAIAPSGARYNILIDIHLNLTC